MQKTEIVNKEKVGKKICSVRTDMRTFIMSYNLPNIQNIEENVDLLF